MATPQNAQRKLVTVPGTASSQLARHKPPHRDSPAGARSSNTALCLLLLPCALSAAAPEPPHQLLNRNERPHCPRRQTGGRPPSQYRQSCGLLGARPHGGVALRNPRFYEAHEPDAAGNTVGSHPRKHHRRPRSHQRRCSPEVAVEVLDTVRCTTRVGTHACLVGNNEDRHWDVGAGRTAVMS